MTYNSLSSSCYTDPKFKNDYDWSSVLEKYGKHKQLVVYIKDVNLVGLDIHGACRNKRYRQFFRNICSDIIKVYKGQDYVIPDHYNRDKVRAWLEDYFSDLNVTTSTVFNDILIKEQPKKWTGRVLTDERYKKLLEDQLDAFGGLISVMCICKMIKK